MAETLALSRFLVRLGIQRGLKRASLGRVMETGAKLKTARNLAVLLFFEYHAFQVIELFNSEDYIKTFVEE